LRHDSGVRFAAKEDRKCGLRVGFIALCVEAAGLTAAAPAHADWWRRPVVVSPPPVYYVPPRVYYPPPTAYYAPGVTFGFTIR
jgi:hypothetical protein